MLDRTRKFGHLKFAITIFLLIFLPTCTFGQNIEITVRVIDNETNKPIRNANVVVSGTTRGTITNALGYFKLTLAPPERELVISHMTYKTTPITVPEGTPSFKVPLERIVYMLSDLDLRAYPDNLNAEKLIPRESSINTPRPDSMIVVESPAGFPYEGGVHTFARLFGNKFRFPEKELLAGAEGKILFGFTIDKNGDYQKVGCLTDASKNFCDEFKRIILEMPRWTPAQQRGEFMDQTFALMIYFGLNDHWKMRIKALKKQRN